MVWTPSMSQLGEETVVQHFDGLTQVVQHCGGVEQAVHVASGVQHWDVSGQATSRFPRSPSRSKALQYRVGNISPVSNLDCKQVDTSARW